MADPKKALENLKRKYGTTAAVKDKEDEEEKTSAPQANKPAASTSTTSKPKKALEDLKKKYGTTSNTSATTTSTTKNTGAAAKRQSASGRDSNVRKSYANRDHELDEIEAGINSGSVRLETAQEELDALKSAYDADPSETTAKNYNDRLEAFQAELDAYNGYVDRYNYYNSSEGIKERHNSAQMRLDDARKAMEMANNWVVAYSRGAGTREQMQKAKEDLANATAAYEQAQKDYDDLTSLYYYTENREQQDKLKADTTMSGNYGTANELTADIDKIAEVMAYYSPGRGGDPEKVEEYKAYLAEKYGIDEQAIREFEVSGTRTSYEPRADGGYSNLFQLYQELIDQKSSIEETLAGAGYDYKRMAEYEQMLADAEEYKRKSAEWAAYAKENPVGASISSVLVSPFQGIDYLSTMMGGIGRSDPKDIENYVPMNVYNMDTTNYVSTMREKVSEDMGAVGSFLYQTGMSIADSATQIAAFGSFAPAIMGTAAASNQARDVILRGGTNRQAFWSGVASGAAELVFEHFSVERLLSIKNVSGWRAVLEQTAKQMGAEASEEAFTEIANILTDAAIMGEKSNFSMAVQQYMVEGLSEADAKKKAFLDAVGQVGLAGLGGALSGGVMGGTTSTASMLYNRTVERDVGERIGKYGDDVTEAIIEIGLQSAKGTESRRMAEQMKAKLYASKKITATEIGALQMAIQRDGQQAQAETEAGEDPAMQVAREAVAEQQAREAQSSPVLTAEELARETVEQQENAEQTKNEAPKEATRNAQAPVASWLKGLGYRENGTKAFEEVMESTGMTVDQAKKFFDTAYEAGLTNMDAKVVASGNDIQKAAYAAGLRDYGLKQKDRQAQSERWSEYTSVASKKDAGFKYDPRELPVGVTKVEADTIDLLGKMLGSTVRMGDIAANAQITDPGDVTLDRHFQKEVGGEKRNIVFYGAHEMGMHRLMQLAPVEGQAFIDAMIRNKNAGLPHGAVTDTQGKKAKYDSKGKWLSVDKAMEEVSADEVFRLYNNDTAAFKAALERVANGKDEKAKAGARKFKDILNDIIQKLKNVWNKLRGKGEAEVAAQVKQTIDEMSELRDLFEKALAVAAERVKAEQANPTKGSKKTAQQDGIQNSIYETYAAEMLAWDGKSKRVFTLGTTSTALQSIGVRDSEIQLKSGKARDILNNPDHDMDQKTLAKLPEVLENPIAILKSQQVTKDNEAYNDGNTSRLVIFGTVNDTKGVPVSVVLELLPMDHGKVLDLSIVASAYGKTTNLSGFVQSSEVMYLDEDKKRTNSWLQSVGVQFPSDAINYGPIGSVTYSGNKVNIEGVPFSEISGATYIAASKEAPPLADWQKKLLEKMNKMGETSALSDGVGTQCSLVEDEETLDFLNNQKLVKVYRAMQEIDGKLYPPMAALIKGQTGKKQLVEATEKGAWYQADEHPELIKLDKNGKPKFELNKGNGGMVPAAYNPYFHTSASPLNDQFSSAYDRPNIVVVEGYIPSSELTSGYKAEYAKDSVGETAWHAGPVASKLKGAKARRVFLSRWFKAERVVPVSEVAKTISKTLEGENVSVPWNVVTPSLREALEARGVKIDYKDVKMGSKVVTFESTQTQYSMKDSEGQALTKEQAEFFKDSKIRDKNGNLLVAYHGTSRGGFTVFEDTDDIGYFFTDSLYTARTYSGSRDEFLPKSIQTWDEAIALAEEYGHELKKDGGKYVLTDAWGKQDYFGKDELKKFTKLWERDFADNSRLEENDVDSVNYPVYLNIKDPYIIDGNGSNWDSVYEFVEGMVEWDDLTAEQQQAFIDEYGEGVEDWGNDQYGDPQPMYHPGELFVAVAQNTRSWVREAVESGAGYDGVIFRNIVDEGGHGFGSGDVSDVFVAFNANQIKATNNLDPTEDDDIRFSLKDSEGHELSEGQREYFKDSVVRDENGNLQVVYHGTRVGGFTVFNRNQNYYTDSRATAESYAPSGAVYEGYLNITTPFVIDAGGEKWSAVPISSEVKKMLDAAGGSTFKERGKWRTSVADIVAAIEELIDEDEADFDGVIVRNVDDTGSYFGGDGKNIGTDYITFKSNQFKNRDNLKPTSDPDIQFSMKEPVEQSGTLIALHNMFEHKLRNTLQLGAWASPSIAIVEAKQGHAGYGPYSAVFRRSTIDPEADSRNKVYGSDAWTPTADNARVEYEVDWDVKREFERNIADLAKDVAGGVFAQQSVLGIAGIEDTTTMNLQEVAHKMATRYDSVRAAYLADKGGDVEIVYRKKEFDSFGNDALKKYIDKHGEQEVARLAAKMLTGERLDEAEIEAAKDAIMEHWTEKNEWRLKQKPELRETRIAKQRDKLSDLRAEDFVRNAWEFYEDSGATTDEVNRMETGENLRRAVDDKAVEAWVLDMLQGLLGRPGIYNGREIFDSRGRSRGFWETHWEYTVENIVKAMNAASARGEGFFGTTGATGLLAKATPEYRSVEEIRADKGRLGQVPQDEYDRLLKELGDELDNVVSEIMRKTEHHTDNQYEEESIIEYVIGEAATGKKTIDAIVKQFRAEDYKISTDLAKKVQNLFKKAEKMPTGYFEAKPQRVVAFEEAVAVLAPSDAPADLLEAMRSAGINVMEYEAGNEAQRLDILNELEDVQFSMKEDDIDLAKQNAKLKAVNQALREQFKRTKFAKADKKAMDSYTKQLLKDYESGADIDETREMLTELYTYMQKAVEGKTQEAENTWEVIQQKANDIAVHILENAVTLDDLMWQETKDVRDIIRTTRITISKEYDHDMGGYESINEFRKANMGRIRLANDGVPVDVFYGELAEMYPGHFDVDKYSTQPDQLLHLAEWIEEQKPVEINMYSNDMRSAATMLADDIIERVYELPQAKPTYADRMNQKVEDARLAGQMAQGRVMAKQIETAKKQIDEYRKKVKDVAKTERTKKEEAVREVKAHYQAKERKMSEHKKEQVLRGRIMRHTQELSKKLLRGTDKQHIPQGLQGAVAELLAAINLETGYTYDPVSNSYKKSDAGLPTKKTEAFNRVREQYRAIAANNDYDMVLDPSLLGVPAEGIPSMLDKVIAMSDIRLVDMNRTQLETVLDVIRVIEHSVNTAGKMLTRSKWVRTSEAADAFVADTASRRAKRSVTERHYMLDIETPYTFFSHYGEAGLDFFRMLRDAQDAEQSMQDQVVDRVGKVVSKEARQKAEKNTQEFTTSMGDTVTLSRAHMMEIYLLSKRPQALNHLLRGGIIQPKVGKIRRGTETIKLTEMDLAQITSALTPEERKIADGLQKITLLLAEWGNKASMQAYGYEKFKDPNYWTIKSSSEGINQDVEKGQNKPRSISNMGSAKSVIPEASNTLDIGGIFETFDQHVSEMLTYSAWLTTMEDANRLFNYKFRDENWNLTGKNMKALLNRYGGDGSTQYWLRLMEDIQNGLSVVSDTSTENIVVSAIGKVKKASVAGNIRVVIQQPTAYLRAVGVLDIDSMVIALGKDAAIAPMIAGWKKAVRYAPIAARKAAGGFEISSNPRQLAEIMYKPETKLGKAKNVVKEAPMWAAGMMDQVTWGTIWNACEHQVGKDNKALTKGSEEFYEAVAALFTEVIDQTQVVDGVLQRSQAMRSGSNFMKQITSFTGEPTQGANMVIRAWDKLRYETDPKKRGKAIKGLGRAAAAYTITAVVNAFAQALVDGLRDDDDEKEYWEKVWSAFSGINGNEKTWWDFARNILLASNVTNNMNPATWLPVWKDVLSLLQGYSVERMDAATIGDFIDSIGNSLKSFSGEGKYTIGYAALKTVVAGGKVLGSSAYNVLRDIEGIVRTIQSGTGDLEAQYNTQKLMTKPKNNMKPYLNLLYKAYTTDKAVYEDMYDDLIASGCDADTIKSGMEERMKAAQGVDKVGDLDQRFMAPNEQSDYDRGMKAIRSSSQWKKATEDQRKEAEERQYSLSIMNGDGEKLQEKIDDGKAYGLSETEYLLYQLALDIYDTPNKNGKLGGAPTNAEKADAILSLDGIGAGEMAYLWDTKDGYEAYAAGVDMAEYISRIGDGQNVSIEKLIGAQDVGIETDAYFDFLDMLDKYDKPTESGKLGTFTQDEAEAAIAAMPGLTREQRAHLWQSMNKSWKAKNNPWG